MFQSLILPMKIGVSYGSGALKALQNDNIPELDLLVREAIQNSSDAAINQPEDSCNINFTQGSFSPEAFNTLLPDIGHILNRRYATATADYLEIRDYKTSGLTGPIRQKDLDPNDHGNYFKLVFDTGKEQTNSSAGEAGGSWGFGKSVYYRVGIGLVIFYTQIKEDGIMKSRLIISLIENETDKDAILKEVTKNAVGRAWWGKKLPESDEEILPLTDETEIQKVLDVFSVKKFSSTQTGTSIIIPYIDKERLLHGIFPDNCGVTPEEIDMCTFKDNIAQYIELAVQKWYAPRVFNKAIKDYSEQKWLAIRINGKPIIDSTMRPLFRLIQELYTTALSANHDSGNPYKSKSFPFIKSVAIPSQKLVGGKAGQAAYVCITKDEMGISGASIKPYTYLRLFNKTSLNDPIVMFTRTPGMILDYKIDGNWAKGLIKPENDDEYILVFFVPNCQITLKNDPSAGDFAGKPFGEYLRRSEKSDHMDWTDPSSFTLISNIKNQVSIKVNAALRGSNEGSVEGTTSKLSGKLGKRLLPTANFGKKPKGGGSGGSGSGGGVPDNLEFILVNKTYVDDSIVMDFSVKFSNAKKKAIIGIFVESETGLVDSGAWQQNIGTDFPITVEAIRECKTFAQNSGKELSLDADCDTNRREAKSDFTRVRIVASDENEGVCGFEIENTITNAIVSGKLVIKTANKKYRCSIKETKKSTKN